MVHGGINVKNGQDNYQKLRTFLLKRFSDYEELFNQSIVNHSLWYAQKFNINKDAVPITISFPGKKTQLRSAKIVHDYRVELNKIPISHIDIILDLYNKTLQHPEIVGELYRLVKDIAIFAYKIDYQSYQQLDKLNIEPPKPELIETLTRKKQAFSFAKRRNYHIKELANVLTWIVLQEDINYPMELGNAGRQMPFDRYTEAITLNDPAIATHYTLETVLERAVAHKKNQRFPELNKVYIDLKTTI